MNVFVDFHHAGLLNSLIMLFEKRLGGNVYRPIGIEWAEQGFWKVYDHPATQQQYLGIGGATPDGTPQLNKIAGAVMKGGDTYEKYGGDVWFCKDIDSGQTNKAITLSAFFTMPIDLVIATIPQHIEPFRELANQHPDKPKLIYQIGNAWNITPELHKMVDGIMSSAKTGAPVGLEHYIEYHQEFDLDIFEYTPPFTDFPPKTISSFVNCFSVDKLFADDWQLFQEVDQLMNEEWEFCTFGGQCRDGAKHGAAEVAKTMINSRFIWHTKRGGDGYGHIIHNAAATGRPIITRFSDYEGKMAADLLIDGITAINIENLSPSEIVEKIKYYDEQGRYSTMSSALAGKFMTVVDFDVEEQAIRNFLKNLV